MNLAIRLDAVGGIAGDMFAAAMVDALPDLRARVLADAAAVLPPGTGTPVFTSGTSAGLHCSASGFRLLRVITTITRPSRSCRLSRHGGTHRGRTAQPRHAAHDAILRLAEAEATIHHVPVRGAFPRDRRLSSLMDVTAGSVAAALEVRAGASPPSAGRRPRAHAPQAAARRPQRRGCWRDSPGATTASGGVSRRPARNSPSPCRSCVGCGVVGRLQGAGTGAARRNPGQPNILRATLFDSGGCARKRPSERHSRAQLRD